ncbi:SAM-dependent methyltransferase [Synechococcus sp. CS-1328]|nr:SAM-dependent methyltransferase [Synechococcus sp. CS-1328]
MGAAEKVRGPGGGLKAPGLSPLAAGEIDALVGESVFPFLRTLGSPGETQLLILVNPHFAGSLDFESTSGKLHQVVQTKKTELLFMALFLQLLKPDGHAAVIVPDGVQFDSSRIHKQLRRTRIDGADRADNFADTGGNQAGTRSGAVTQQRSIHRP